MNNEQSLLRTIAFDVHNNLFDNSDDTYYPSLYPDEPADTYSGSIRECLDEWSDDLYVQPEGGWDY